MIKISPSGYPYSCDIRVFFRQHHATKKLANYSKCYIITFHCQGSNFSAHLTTMSTCKSHSKCINTAMANADAICEERGLRFTDVRRQVLKLIWASHVPAKAYDILQNLGDKDNIAKPPTVYRALDFLRDNGLVHKISRLNAYVGCGHPLKHQACYFLICTECGNYEECCNSELTTVVTKTAARKKFTPTQISLEIEGLCVNCQG